MKLKAGIATVTVLAGIVATYIAARIKLSPNGFKR
jgi:hypothetical protein